MTKFLIITFLLLVLNLYKQLDQYPYNSDSVPSSSSVAYVGSTSIHPKLPLPSLSSILRYAYQGKLILDIIHNIHLKF